MSYKSTDELTKLLKSAKTVPELEEYTRLLSIENSACTFSEFLNNEISARNIPVPDLIAASQIQRNYAYQILNGNRNPSRDKVLSLCLALHLNLTATQRALTLSSNSQLYSRNRRDSILIFALSKNMSVFDTNELLYEMKETPLT